MTNQEYCIIFRRLPSATLPSALFLDDEDDMADAHESVRHLAAGRCPIYECSAGLARELHLRADADGWRTGVTLTLES